MPLKLPAVVVKFTLLPLMGDSSAITEVSCYMCRFKACGIRYVLARQKVK